MIAGAALAAAAEIERDLRAEHYPAQVARREISAEEAEHDFQAWAAIAAWLADGGTAFFDWGLRWPDLELAASRALLRREEACQAKPDSRPLADRRGNVASILALLQRQRSSIETLNAELRAGATARAAA